MSTFDEQQKLIDEKQQLYGPIDDFFSRDPTDEMVSSLEKLLTASPAFEGPESDLDSTKDFRQSMCPPFCWFPRNL
ncbi:hypothetical protein FVEN_g11591 [Fusarium venenatum]|nr:hypothetical protein FVEN_g11591 [Fusarium venenatum]